MVVGVGVVKTGWAIIAAGVVTGGGVVSAPQATSNCNPSSPMSNKLNRTEISCRGEAGFVITEFLLVIKVRPKYRTLPLLPGLL